MRTVSAKASLGEVMVCGLEKSENWLSICPKQHQGKLACSRTWVASHPKECPSTCFHVSSRIEKLFFVGVALGNGCWPQCQGQPTVHIQSGCRRPACALGQKHAVHNKIVWALASSHQSVKCLDNVGEWSCDWVADQAYDPVVQSPDQQEQLFLFLVTVLM